MIGLQEFLQSTACVPLSAAEEAFPREAVRGRNITARIETARARATKFVIQSVLWKIPHNIYKKAQ